MARSGSDANASVVMSEAHLTRLRKARAQSFNASEALSCGFVEPIDPLSGITEHREATANPPEDFCDELKSRSNEVLGLINDHVLESGDADSLRFLGNEHRRAPDRFVESFVSQLLGSAARDTRCKMNRS